MEIATHKHMLLFDPQIHKMSPRKSLEAFGFFGVNQPIDLAWYRVTKGLMKAIWSKFCCKIALMQSLIVNGKIPTSVFSLCSKHLHQRYNVHTLTFSLGFGNCSFLCFKQR